LLKRVDVAAKKPIEHEPATLDQNQKGLRRWILFLERPQLRPQDLVRFRRSIYEPDLTAEQLDVAGRFQEIDQPTEQALIFRSHPERTGEARQFVRFIGLEIETHLV